MKFLSELVYTEIDYGGLFFTSHRERLIENRFEYVDNRIFKDKIASLNEAVDKCGFWSSLLHVYYMYAYTFGLERDDVLCFVLFFAHQCNSTIIIVQAMLDIMQSRMSHINARDSLYIQLSRACKKYKVKDNWNDVGCGGGGFERFSPSNNLIYDEEKVASYIQSLNEIFADVTCNFETKKEKKLTPRICFDCYYELEEKLLSTFKGGGIGKVRVSHLIQLSALLGLIPLHFYVYMPIHLSGGTGFFLKNELGYLGNKIDTDQYLKDLTLLQSIYGLNFTSNMFENMSCILGRKNEVKDVFYYLPWIKKDDNSVSPKITEKTYVQLTFRVNVKTIKNIELLCVSDGKPSTVISTQPPNSFRPVLQYSNNGGHSINADWMLNQYNNDRTKHKVTYSLPKFDNFYNSVSYRTF